MLQSQEPTTTSPLRKLRPQAKIPTAAVLRSLSSEDMRLLKRRLSEPVECVMDARFEEADAAEVLMGPLPQSPRGSQRSGMLNDDSGANLLASPSGAALTTEQEQHLFLRLNYCRYRVMNVFEKHGERRLSAEATRELLRWERATRQVRGDIVRANVPLVLAMAKRTRIANVDFADLISEGNLALLRSVDKFDCGRGFKFSTYACRAILKSFSRVAGKTSRYRGHFPTEYDPTLEKSDLIERKRISVEDDCVDELRSILGKNLASLNEVEQRVIRERFALDAPPQQGDRAAKAKTLEQVGEMIGVTKERVRQIQNKALGKLRTALQDEVLST